MKLKAITALLGLVLAIGAGHAQSRGALRINEVMVVNNDNAVDDYGRHSAWIELFNSGFAPLEISKIYLTNDTANKTMYAVPLGDVNTRIPKRQHVIFWADGNPTLGTFHTSFVLEPGRENHIAIYDADGKTLIDEVVVPADLAPNTSYARSVDGAGVWEVRAAMNESDYITPSSNNVIVEGNQKVKFFSERDASGLGLTVMAMCIVFAALLLLSICFYVINRIGAAVQRRNKIKSQSPQAVEAAARGEKPGHDSGEEIAAIVMALHEHMNVHDRESTILTLNKVRRAYSPWNSKIYNMRELPNRANH